MTDKYAKLREAAEIDGAQLLKEIVAGLEGVTPGPWHAEDTGLYTIRHGRNVVADSFLKADRDHFLRLCPDNVRTIHTAFQAAEARATALEAERDAEKARADAAEAEREERLAWSKTITTKLSDAIGRGSEMFRRHGEQYRVDPDFVATYIRDRRQSFHEAMLKNAEARNRDRATIATLTAERDALKRERDEAREALKPFSRFAGIVFERNFNNDDPVDTMTASDGGQVSLCARDFFRARSALSDANAAERE